MLALCDMCAAIIAPKSNNDRKINYLIIQDWSYDLDTFQKVTNFKREFYICPECRKRLIKYLNRNRSAKGMNLINY